MEADGQDAARVHRLVPRAAAPGRRGAAGVTNPHADRTRAAVTPEAQAGGTCRSRSPRWTYRCRSRSATRSARWHSSPLEGGVTVTARSDRFDLPGRASVWDGLPSARLPAGRESASAAAARRTGGRSGRPRRRVAGRRRTTGPHRSRGRSRRGPRCGQRDAPDQPHHHARVSGRSARGGGGLHALGQLELVAAAQARHR